ncbi:hypothetical protein HDC96_001292 [Stenotrophomonas sp. JAI102]|nr:hypothetical protein [Stenotrophomonas sp. JAI102]
MSFLRGRAAPSVTLALSRSFTYPRRDGAKDGAL